MQDRSTGNAFKEDRHFVTALARGLEVLACFRTSDRVLGNQEIARRCGLPKSTVSRLTSTLTRLGYLAQAEGSHKYSLGTACLRLGSAMLSRLDIRKVARPLMQELADFSGGTVSLGTRDRFSMIYVEHCRSCAAIALTLDTGSRIPVATSAIGRAWLAVVPDQERQAFMEQVRDVDDMAWPRLRQGIEQGLADHLTLGVTCSMGDWQPNVNGIARGFEPGHGMPPMAINVGGPSFRLSPSFLLDEVRPRLLEVVRQLEGSFPR